MSQKKTVPVLFFNNSVTHWPILIIFGMQHHKETWCKRLELCPSQLNTVATLPGEMQKSYFGSLLVLLANGISVYALAFVLEANILSICCSKDDVMCVIRVTFLRDNNCQSCLS